MGVASSGGHPTRNFPRARTAPAVACGMLDRVLGWIALLVYGGGAVALVLYLLVRFVKWAWYQ